MISIRSLGATTIVGLLTLACGSEANAPSRPSVEPTAEPTPASPAEARARWVDTGFELDSSTPGALAADQEGHFDIRLAATGIYHVNQDYPISVQITAPDGVTLPRATLARPDAAEFSERVARFEVPIVAPAGHHDLRAVVDFAVCTDEGCMPDTRTLAIGIDVP